MRFGALDVLFESPLTAALYSASLKLFRVHAPVARPQYAAATIHTAANISKNIAEDAFSRALSPKS